MKGSFAHFWQQSWRIFWTLTVALGLTVALFRIDRTRADAMRTKTVSALSDQTFAQFGLLSAAGTLQAQDRIARAAALLNSGPESKQLKVRVRTALTEDTESPRLAFTPEQAFWSRRLQAADDRTLELTWSLQETRVFGATSPQDADLRVVLVFFMTFLALWVLGRGLFGTSAP